MRVLVTSFTGKMPDRATVEEALRSVNGAAQAHTIMTFEHLYQIALSATHLRLYSGLVTAIQVFDLTHVYDAINPAQHRAL